MPASAATYVPATGALMHRRSCYVVPLSGERSLGWMTWLQIWFAKVRKKNNGIPPPLPLRCWRRKKERKKGGGKKKEEMPDMCDEFKGLFIGVPTAHLTRNTSFFKNRELVNFTPMVSIDRGGQWCTNVPVFRTPKTTRARFQWQWGKGIGLWCILSPAVLPTWLQSCPHYYLGAAGGLLSWTWNILYGCRKVSLIMCSAHLHYAGYSFAYIYIYMYNVWVEIEGTQF